MLWLYTANSGCLVASYLFCFVVVPKLCSLPGLLPNHGVFKSRTTFYLFIFNALHLISTWVILQSLHLPLMKGLIQVTTMTMMQGSFKADKLLYEKHEHQKCSRWRKASKKPHCAENNVFVGTTCMGKGFQNDFFFVCLCMRKDYFLIFFAISCLWWKLHLLGRGKISCVCPVEALVSPKCFMRFCFSNIVNDWSLSKKRSFG